MNFNVSGRRNSPTAVVFYVQFWNAFYRERVPGKTRSECERSVRLFLSSTVLPGGAKKVNLFD